MLKGDVAPKLSEDFMDSCDIDVAEDGPLLEEPVSNPVTPFAAYSDDDSFISP